MSCLGDVIARLQACWRLKTGLSTGLSILFAVPYFTLQHYHVFPVLTLQPTFLDDAIAFDPRWVWPYQSVYLLIAVVPWLARERTHLVRYARGFVLVSMVGFVCFLLWPIAAPRPAAVPGTGMFAWLVWYDGVTNTLPSLHVGLAVYTLLVGAEMSNGALAGATRRRLLRLGAVWVACIAYAAVVTKQHYVVDLPAGLLLAWLAHRVTWGAPADAHSPDRARTTPTMPEPSR